MIKIDRFYVVENPDQNDVVAIISEHVTEEAAEAAQLKACGGDRSALQTIIVVTGRWLKFDARLVGVAEVTDSATPRNALLDYMAEYRATPRPIANYRKRATAIHHNLLNEYRRMQDGK
jgi:hypothetical protein